MMHSDFFGSAPLPVLFLFMVLGLAGFALLGMVLRARLHTGGSDGNAEGYLLSAALALLGLLIGFTFSMALSRYEERREMLVAEANAIGTAWLRSGLAPGAEGEALRREIRTYVLLRATLPDAEDAERVETLSADAQRRVWSALQRALPATPAPIGATMINATTEMFDAASSRHWERVARIPALVLDVLIACALISGGIVGYVLGHEGRRHWPIMGLVFTLLSLSIVLILDLDRPWSGLVTISQEPMQQAAQAVR